VNGRYAPEDEDADDTWTEHPATWCDCVGTEVARPDFHATNCPRYAPPPRGPGSTPEGRARALRLIREALADARRRHQENQA
jgi:hypothetical protein